MSAHEAGAQMLGYFYQARYALYMLLNNGNDFSQISIEKFDDVAFEESGTPVELVQVKHHTNRIGNLSDRSVDLWRTIKVWLDRISSDHTLLETTRFTLITTGHIIKNTAADKIKSKDYDAAYNILKDVASENKSKENEGYYQAFLSMDEKSVKTLLSHIVIFADEPDINYTFEDIKTTIKYSCKFSHLNAVAERVEGWWFQEVIKALMSKNPVIMSQRQIHNKIIEIARQFDDDNLPIECWKLDSEEEEKLGLKDRIFLKQLRLIQSSEKNQTFAIFDYYRASMQRSSWIRQGLVSPDELQQYDFRLTEEWARDYEAMNEDLFYYGEPADEEKVREGRALYRKVSQKDIRIREKCNNPFVMRGTYHILADTLDVGWHSDYKMKLECYMTGVDYVERVD